ncbi:MAG: hypothetical protein KH230_09760 [Enterocloster asparagiformis]|nr:hypothetical protein [Enterocloster asparagiformis]
MNRNINRDQQLLVRIRSNQEKIASYLARFSCKREADLFKPENEICLEACSFNMLNLYEDYKNLTMASQEALCFIDGPILRTLRNMIGHTYQTADKRVLTAYIFLITKKECMDMVTNRIRVCQRLRTQELDL